MKSEQGERRENGYPRTPEPEISKPLAGLPKPLAFGPPAMPGLSFPPNLGGLGKFFFMIHSYPKYWGQKWRNPMILFFFSQVDSQARAPLASVSYLQAPTRACQVYNLFPTRACQVSFSVLGMPGILKKQSMPGFFAPIRACYIGIFFCPYQGLPVIQHPTSIFIL